MYKYEDIRNFYLENEKGNKIDFQSFDGGLFLYKVSGLGYEENISYEQVGDTFIPINKQLVQKPIEGTLEFDEKSYDEYHKFVNFVNKSKNLKLIYVPKLTNRIEFYRDIDFTRIDKSEEDDFGILSCAISMSPKTLWYKKEDVKIEITSIPNEVRWDFKWDSIFIDYNNKNIIYKNMGHTESAIQVVMNGYIKNPTITVYQDEEKIYELKIEIEIQEYEKYLFSSKDGELYIKKQNTDGTYENLFKNPYIDIKNTNIFKLPLGVSKLQIHADNDINNARISILEFYKSV